MTTATPEAPPGREGMTDKASNHAMRWWILAVLGVAQLMVILDNTIVNIALPDIMKELHAGLGSGQFVLTIYPVALAIVFPPEPEPAR